MAQIIMFVYSDLSNKFDFRQRTPWQRLKAEVEFYMLEMDLMMLAVFPGRNSVFKSPAVAF